MTRPRLGRKYRAAVIAVVALFTAGLAPWGYVRAATASDISAPGTRPANADAALVFGTLVNEDGTLSPRLLERVELAAQLYADGVVPLLVMSGTDASHTGQDETAAMRDAAIRLGVPASAIVLDPDGLDSFQTCQNAAHVFGLHRVVVVTQEFHVARATWLCQRAGLDAQGAYMPITMAAWTVRGNLREVPASVLAVWEVLSGRGPGRAPADG